MGGPYRFTRVLLMSLDFISACFYTIVEAVAHIITHITHLEGGSTVAHIGVPLLTRTEACKQITKTISLPCLVIH